MNTATPHEGPPAQLLLVAHGTRNPAGVELVAEVAEAVAKYTGTARVAFVDVLGPSPAEALRQHDGPVVVVPAFLASGYHVRTDVPREIADSGHQQVAVARTLGPDPVLARVLLDRLVEAGWRRGDSVVLAAAGSSDARALRDVQRVAVMLSDMVGTTVETGYIATAEPKVPEVVAEVRASRGGKVFIASYLLAPGLFHNRLAEAGADGVAAPIGVHPELVRLVAARYFEALAAVPTPAPQGGRALPAVAGVVSRLLAGARGR
jgi:sirohydrochlorin ferrochelatase